MWRSIFSQVLYQFIVLTVMLYAGPTMFGIKYNLVDTELKVDNVPTARMQHYTFLFHTFVLMNALNMINCRVIGTEDDKELNIFRRIHHNWFFPCVVLTILNFQYAIVSYPFLRGIFGCTPLTLNMHITAFCLGLGSLLVALVVKFTPYSFAEKLGNFMMPFEQRNFIVGKQIAQAIEDPLQRQQTT